MAEKKSKVFDPRYDEQSPTEKLKTHLLETADRMAHLANRLEKGGEKLHSEDKNLCRLALLPVADEIFMEAKSAFVAGAHPDYISDSLVPFLEWVKLLN